MPIVTTVKWAAQLLFIASGIAALFVEKTRKDEKTGRKRLTLSGWLTIGAMVAAVVVFAVTQRAEAIQAERRAKEAALQAAAARKLALGQHRFSGVSLAWALPAAFHEQARLALSGAGGNLDARFRIYAPTALRHGSVSILGSGARRRAELELARPMGILRATYPAGSPELAACERLVRAARGTAFAGDLLPGGARLFEWNDDSPPESVLVEGGRIRVCFHSDVSAALLEGSQIAFQLGVLDTTGLPQAITVQSLDPLIAWRRDYKLHWEHRATGAVRGIEPGETEPIMIFISNPEPVEVEFSRRLLTSEAPK